MIDKVAIILFLRFSQGTLLTINREATNGIPAVAAPVSSHGAIIAS
jgi:hypothetical protein